MPLRLLLLLLLRRQPVSVQVCRPVVACFFSPAMGSINQSRLLGPGFSAAPCLFAAAAAAELASARPCCSALHCYQLGAASRCRDGEAERCGAVLLPRAGLAWPGLTTHAAACASWNAAPVVGDMAVWTACKATCPQQMEVDGWYCVEDDDEPFATATDSTTAIHVKMSDGGRKAKWPNVRPLFPF
ncbi:hypothetical protein BKA80DRAFT_264348 [Phyllosticta citrichinensis]